MNGDIPDKGIFFDQPTQSDDTCLLTCRPKDVDLTPTELRKLGQAMLDAANKIDGKPT